MADANWREPPRFVPTLTEVVLDETQALPADSSGEPLSADLRPDLKALQTDVQAPVQSTLLPVNDSLVAKLPAQVMARLDAVWQDQLNAALEAAVAAHAQAFYQAVRSDVAQLVKAAVQEVIEQERAKKL